MIQQEPVELFIGCDNRFVWDQMVGSSAGIVIPDAAPTFLLKQSDGTTTVSGSTGVMTAVAGRHGGYEGVIPSTVTLTVDLLYYLQITTSVNGMDDFRRIDCRAKYRGLR